MIPTALQAIERALAAQSPAGVDHLCPPMHEAEISVACANMGPCPPDLRELWRWHGGSSPMVELYPGFGFATVACALRNWDHSPAPLPEWDTLVPVFMATEPSDRIFVVECNPASDRYGAVLDVDPLIYPESPFYGLVAQSMTELLCHVAASLDSGVLRYVQTRLQVVDIGFYRHRVFSGVRT